MSIEAVWFVLLAGMLTIYVVLDGFDLGVGIVHLWAARTDRERQACIRSIGPVWDGNEVWLVAAGGTLVMAFPVLYARGFSGFYLPLIMVLWLLVFRALAIELRHHIDNTVWKPFWDAAFFGSSLLLALILGAALGNVIRGVPATEGGHFFAPLFTDFGVGAPVGILDWFTVLVGLTAVAMIALHGALWLAHRVDGPVRERVLRLSGRLWWVAGAAVVAASAATFAIQPQVLDNLSNRPWGVPFPLLAAASYIAIAVQLRRGQPAKAFLASCGSLVGLLSSAAFGIFPYVLPGRRADDGLTLYEAAAPASGLSTALYWWIPGMLIATGYFVYLYRSLPKTISVSD